MITDGEMQKVNEYLEWLKGTGLVEKECGAPVKVTVDWAKRKVLVQGPRSGRELDLNDILRTP